MPDEKHFPTRSLGYVPDEKTFATPNLGRRLSGQIAKIADEDCLVAPHFRLGASPHKGPGENKFFTKRISWSDWKICFRPDPLAETKPKTRLRPKFKTRNHPRTGYFYTMPGDPVVRDGSKKRRAYNQ